MKTACAFTFIVFCFSLSAGSLLKHGKEITKSIFEDAMDVSDFSVYYDLKTNETIKKMMPRPWYKPGWLLRLPFIAGPCSCEGLQCRCCTGIRIPAVQFDRQTCTILTFEPSESTINMDVQMNNVSIYRNSFSARNPPPFCVPIPVPYLPPGFMDMCVRLFDITVMDQKLHMCLDMDTRVDKAPVLVLHFDCMDMGFNGIGLSKPGGSGSSDQTNVLTEDGTGTTSEPTQDNSDVFDLVTESNSVTTTETPFNVSIKYI